MASSPASWKLVLLLRGSLEPSLIIRDSCLQTLEACPTRLEAGAEQEGDMPQVTQPCPALAGALL